MAQKIVMLLSNPFRPDPRVLKETQSLAKAGYDITIICWDRLAEFMPEETLPSGVKIIRIRNIKSSYGVGPRQLLVLPRFWCSALRELDRIHPSMIHCHDFDTLPAGLAWGKWHHKPVIYDAHEYYADLVKPRLRGALGKSMYFLTRLFEKRTARLANAIVTVDEKLANLYLKINQSVLILGHYPPRAMAESSNPIFTKLELNMLYAGRISKDRGSLLYLELLRCLRDRHIPARLTLVGTFTPQEEKDVFYKNAHGLEDCIEYLGWIPYEQMPEIYQRADIGMALLLPEPRYIAALPVKLFEYMASGLVVLASDFPSISTIVNETHCGVVSNPLSPPSEIASVIENWWNEPSTPQEMGENGRLAICAKYNWETEVGCLDEIYHKLLS